MQNDTYSRITVKQTINSLIELLKEMERKNENEAFLSNIPEILEGVEKALHRLAVGEEPVWETVGNYTIQASLMDDFPPGGGKRLRINVQKG